MVCRRQSTEGAAQGERDQNGFDCSATLWLSTALELCHLGHRCPLTAELCEAARSRRGLSSSCIPGTSPGYGLQESGLWRASVRAPLCSPALLCVVQRLLEHGKDLAFSKYVQCINNACLCAAAAGKNVCRTSGAKGYWRGRCKPKHLIVAFCFIFCLFWCALRVENVNFCIILALSDKINILYIYLDYFFKDPTPCMSWKNLWNPIQSRSL